MKGGKRMKGIGKGIGCLNRNEILYLNKGVNSEAKTVTTPSLSLSSPPPSEFQNQKPKRNTPKQNKSSLDSRESYLITNLHKSKNILKSFTLKFI